MDSLALATLLIVPVILVLGGLALVLRRQRVALRHRTTRDDPTLREEVRRLIASGKRRQASRVLRRRTGMGTMDADRFLDEVAQPGT